MQLKEKILRTVLSGIVLILSFFLIKNIIDKLGDWIYVGLPFLLVVAIMFFSNNRTITREIYLPVYAGKKLKYYQKKFLEEKI